jgi:hypothetical protein
MLLIANRANLHGPNPETENAPSTIEEVIQQCYNCEVDVRYIDKNLYLGHDEPQYLVTIDFLLKYADFLWIHCKNIEALDYLLDYKQLRVFWQQEDSYTLTSNGYIWGYPGQKSTKITVISMPEWHDFTTITTNSFAVCSDYIIKIQEEYDFATKS